MPGSSKKRPVRKQVLPTQVPGPEAVAQIVDQDLDLSQPGLEVGATGLRRFSGMIDEEWLRTLKGSRAAKVYREMKDNDPVIGAMLFAVEMLLRNVEWMVEPVDPNEPADVEAAEFIETAREDLDTSWSDQIAEILSMLPFGWSLHEVVLKTRRGRTAERPELRSRHDDGRLGWARLAIRGQTTLERWEFDERGNVVAIWQRPPPDYKLRRIPIDKTLLFRTTVHKGNPEGRSVLRNAFRPWFFKKRIEEIEGIGLERDLAGLPVARVPAKIMSPNASAIEKAIYNEIKNIVTTIRRDEQEGVVFPSDVGEGGEKLYDLSLMSTGGTRQFNTTDIIQRYDQRIAMTVLADFILLGHEKVGSFALSDSKTNLFATAVGAWLQSIAQVFNRQAIPDLLAVNGMNGQCELRHGDLEDVDLEKLGNFIRELSGAGAALFPDEELENDLRRKAHLPARTVDEGLIGDLTPGREPEEDVPPEEIP